MVSADSGGDLRVEKLGDGRNTLCGRGGRDIAGRVDADNPHSAFLESLEQ